MRSPRSVTLQPIARPSRSLNDAIALRDLVTSGFWPVIFVRSVTAASMTFLSATASPTPMFTVILVMLRHLHGVREPQVLLELRHDLLAIVLVQPRLIRHSNTLG